MLQPIEEQARRVYLTASAAIAVCALLIASLAGASSGALHHQQREKVPVPSLHLDDPWKAGVVNVTRDPFFSAFAAPDVGRPGGRRLVGMRVTQGELILPGNANDVSLRATATGGRPRAIVDVNGSIKIVAPGDVINGNRIESILPGRIVLKGGLLLLSRNLP